MKRSNLALGAILFVLGLAVVVGGAVALLQQAARPAVTAASDIGGPFRLVDQDGETITDEAVRGRPFVVFFGFTHCPDICPAKLYELSEVLKAMGDDGDRLPVLFVSVDPERDTPEVLKRYLSSFHSGIRGLTGEQAAVDATVKAYRAYARKVPLEDGGYTMDHTAVVYLMDREGRFVAPLNLDREPAEVARELRRYL